MRPRVRQPRESTGVGAVPRLVRSSLLWYKASVVSSFGRDRKLEAEAASIGTSFPPEDRLSHAS
jgi:hypothetical protein